MLKIDEEEEWRRRMVGRGGRGGKVKLERYVGMKKDLRGEDFLTESRVWVRKWVQMRAGVVKVEEELGRHRGVIRGDRMCKRCDMGVVENIEHVIDECPQWKEERRMLWEDIRKVDELMGVREMGKGRRESEMVDERG